MGLPDEQARIQANALRDSLHGNSASKKYLDMKQRELEIKLSKWQMGLAFALAVIVVRGFGWLGF